MIECEDEQKLRAFYDKRISHEVDGDVLGDEFNGYVLRIAGGNDKQGFPMKQGVLTSSRVRLLLGAGHSCFRERRKGMRKRKSVRGCIVGPEIAVLNLIVVSKGEGEIEGLTDKVLPRRLGPKRAANIKKLFNLTKEDDVRQYVTRRPIETKNGKKYFKAPKIQRLITPQRIQRKRKERALKRTRFESSRKDAEDYLNLVATRAKEARDARHNAHLKRRSASRHLSTKSNDSEN